MNKLTLPFLTLLSFFLIFLSGCSSLLNNHQQITEHQNITERTKKLEALSDWKIKGKLGMISPKERHSLTLNWLYQGERKRQTLNLTAVLGVQIFNLESVNGMHVINVDGQRYQSPDLNVLLSSLTGFTLPTQAMSFWLKGLPYLNSDKITYNVETQLPNTLTSFHDGKKWLLKYGAYQQVGQYQLATKFTIKQEDLTIKINVHQWDVTINEQY
ncbi:MAG: outer membrane lipoprotein LolB [Colwellia sp.]|nr:outer membrane lipoprotein LolB [Colwellia sp.]